MKLMYICTGNICRSAMAEGMMKKIAIENNLNIEVCSAGVYAETGDYATYNAIETMKEYNVDIGEHKATNIRDSKIKEMDLILCATMSHKQTLNYIYPELKEKIYTMKEYAKMDKEGQDLNIKDPWGYEIDTYRKCASEIEKTCQRGRPFFAKICQRGQA